MRRLTSPTGLLLIILFLSLIFTNFALGFECTNAGAGSTAPDDGEDASNTACGDGAVASGFLGGSTAVGWDATAAGDFSTAVGKSATASGTGSAALGNLATAGGERTTAVGGGATTGGAENTVLGNNTKALSPHGNATALGFGSQVEQSNAMVLGSIPGVNDPHMDNEYVAVGIGTSTPDAPLHIFRDDGTLEFMFLESDAEGGAQDRAMMQLNNNGGIRFQFDNTLTGNAWRFQAGTGNLDNFEITKVGTGVLEMRLDGTGNLTIQGTLTQNSDVNAKQDIEAVDGQMLLAKLDALPVAEWTYKRDSSGARHLGPMAQDFHAAFGLGEDETKIAPGDMAGISLAAIKALNAQHEKAMAEKEAQLITLQQEKDAEIAEVKDRLDRLESLIQGLNKPTAGL